MHGCNMSRCGVGFVMDWLSVQDMSNFSPDERSEQNKTDEAFLNRTNKVLFS